MELMTINEDSSQCRVPVATLRRRRLAGVEGPKSFKLVGRVVYSRADVEAWLLQQREAG